MITNTRGEPEIQLNISANIYNQIRALLKTTRDKKSVSLDLPLNRYISVRAEEAYYSEEKANKKTQTETGFDVKFRFPF